MFFRLKEDVLRSMVKKAFRKAGNIRKLEKEIKIPRSTLSDYHTEKRLINKNNLRKLEKFLDVNYHGLKPVAYVVKNQTISFE